MNEPSYPSSSSPSPPDPQLPRFPWSEPIGIVLARYEKRILEAAMEQSHGVKRQAAKLLGISRYALERRLGRVAKLFGDAQTPREKSAGAGGA